MPPLISPILIGREGHVSTLHQLVEQAKIGEGHVALISGEAGIGKSRLVAEIKTFAAPQGFLLLEGHCFPTDVTFPYAPLLDLLRALSASHPPATLATALESLARDIFPLLPELAAGQALPSPAPSLEPEQEKRRLFALLATFFMQLSIHSPLLLIIEDIHWSDDTSLDFLHYLARHALAHPLLLLITYRHDEMRPELSSWLAELDRERLAREIPLTPLSRDHLDTMLSAIFDQHHTAYDMHRFHHGDLRDTLYSLTEGNPFFVEETLSSLIAEGDIYYAQGHWNRKSLNMARIPRSVQDAVRRRTQRLGEESRHVLTLAAVAGRQFDFALLQHLTSYDEHQLLLIMKELVAAQLVVEVSVEEFAFRHALTRQAIYRQLLARESASLHRTIAQTIEQLHLATLEGHLEDLAYHYYQARDWQKALDYARRAGEKALRLYSHRAAIDYFTWALDAADHLPEPALPSLYSARGQAYETLGEFERAQQDYTQALEAARKVNDRPAEWQSLIHLGFLAAERDYLQAESWFRQALDLSQELNDPSLHARSLNRIGNWYMNVEQPHKALDYHMEALAIFQELSDAAGTAETLDLLGMTSYLGGDLSQGTAYYQQVIALFKELGDQQGLTSSLATLALRAPTFQTDSMASTASLAEARQDAEHALRIAREIGHRPAEAYALFQLALCLGSQGEFGQALQTGQQSLRIADEIEHLQWQTAAHAVLGEVYRGMLAHAQARKYFEKALSLAREIGSLFWTRLTTGYLASTVIALNDLAQAEQLLQATIDPETPPQTMAQRIVWCAAVELALAQDQPARALEIIDQLMASGAQAGHGLRILELRGMALAALQRSTEAETALKLAYELAVAQGARPAQWRIGVAIGNFQGRSAEAEPALASARVLIEELASTITDELLRENFLRLTSAQLPVTRPLSQSRSMKQAFGGLTEREREVAILIAQGNSNQEIADALVVTKRTIETHISNIMFKLGCTSRTQIAVWAVEAGLVNSVEDQKGAPSDPPYRRK